MNISDLAERLSAFAPSHRRVSTVPRGRSVLSCERLPLFRGDFPLFEGTFLLHIREKDILYREFSTDTKEIFLNLRALSLALQRENNFTLGRRSLFRGDLPLFEGTFLLHIREKDTLYIEFSTDTKEIFGTLRELFTFSSGGRGACALVW